MLTQLGNEKKLINSHFLTDFRAVFLGLRLIENYRLAKRFIDEQSLEDAFIKVTECKNDLVRLIFLIDGLKDNKNFKLLKLNYKRCLTQLRDDRIYEEPKLFKDILTEALLIIKRPDDFINLNKQTILD